MQHGSSLQMVQNYLGYYSQKTVKRNINGMMASFFMAAMNAYGEDPSMRDQGSPFGMLRHDSR